MRFHVRAYILSGWRYSRSTMPRDEVAEESQPTYQPEQSESYGHSQVGAPAPRGSGATNVKPKNFGHCAKFRCLIPKKKAALKWVISWRVYKM